MRVVFFLKTLRHRLLWGNRTTWKLAYEACHLSLMNGGLTGKFPLIREQITSIISVPQRKYSNITISRSKHLDLVKQQQQHFKIIWYFARVAVAKNSEPILSLLDTQKSNRIKLTLFLIKMNQAVGM